jgi:hypothetical protein
MIWRHNARTGTWEATASDWRAVVVRLSDTGDWYPFIERIHPPHDRRDGPTSAFSLEGRTWCEVEMKRLSAEEASP